MAVTHLNALRALEAAVRLGSFRAAGDELGVTAAAVGQLVRKLEDALGKQLVRRHANGFEPTDETREAAARLAVGFAEMRRGMALLSDGRAGTQVDVTVTPSIAERWLAPRLSSLIARNPEIDLRIDTAPHVHYNWEHDFDFAIRYDRPGRSGRPETPLFGEVLIPTSTPEIAAMIGPTDRPDCLADVPMLHVDRSTDDPDWFHWEEWGRAFGYEISGRHRRLHFTFTTMVLSALYDGHGLHLAQLSIVLPDLISGRLVAPFGTRTCTRPKYCYSLVSMRTGPETAVQRDFRDWITREGQEVRKGMDAYLEAHRNKTPPK